MKLTKRQITTLEIGYRNYKRFLDNNAIPWVLMAMSSVLVVLLVTSLALGIPYLILPIVKFHAISLVGTLIAFRFTNGYAEIKERVDRIYHT